MMISLEGFYEGYVRDGIDQSVQFLYSNGHRPVRFIGKNAYPYECNSFSRLFGVKLDDSNNEKA